MRFNPFTHFLEKIVMYTIPSNNKTILRNPSFLHITLQTFHLQYTSNIHIDRVIHKKNIVTMSDKKSDMEDIPCNGMVNKVEVPECQDWPPASEGILNLSLKY